MKRLTLHLDERKIIEPKNIFFIFAILNFVIFGISLILSDGVAFEKLFFYDTSDTFMDFFNPIKFSLTGNPYDFKEMGADYPPIAYLIFRLLGHFIPGSKHMDAYQLRESQMGQVLLLLFTLICTLAMFYLTYRVFNGKEYEKLLFLLTLIFSLPLLFLFERGNILLLVVALLMAFLVLRDSNNAVIREISLICLALAAGIKLYPAIFGLLLIVDKKYSQVVRCLIYGVVIFIVPFFFFDGFKTMHVFVENLTQRVSNTHLVENGIYARTDLSALIAFPYLAIKETLIGCELLAKTLSVPISLHFIIGSFLFKEKWQKILCLTLVMIVLPPLNYTYCIALYFLPIVAFFSKNEYTRFEFVFAMLFVMILVPVAFGNSHSIEDTSYSQLLHIVAQDFLLILVITQIAKNECISIVNFIEKHKNKTAPLSKSLIDK